MSFRPLLFAAALVALALPASAQPVPEFKFEHLSITEVQSLGKGLTKLPYEEAAPLIAKLQQQFTEQQKPSADPKADKPADN